MRIGVFGGTFDPPHNGHLAVAEACLRELALDEILFLPTNQNPLKKRDRSTPAKVRLQMLRRILKDKGRMAISDMDITRGGKSYAVDTMEELQVARPADYWFIMGTDAARMLPQWKNPERLLRLCRIAIVTRPTVAESEILIRMPAEWKSHIDVVRMPAVDVSSSLIRDRFAAGREVSLLLPRSVEEFVRENKLYV
jgi:nicotinate-nucleotide adenylyltransferase